MVHPGHGRVLAQELRPAAVGAAPPPPDLYTVNVVGIEAEPEVRRLVLRVHLQHALPPCSTGNSRFLTRDGIVAPRARFYKRATAPARAPARRARPQPGFARTRAPMGPNGARVIGRAATQTLPRSKRAVTRLRSRRRSGHGPHRRRM